jgi:SAM-dependent methyltransferase
MHQVLHFLRDPQRAVREAARVLAPSGRLLIVDFAPHELAFLQEQFAHERLGLAEAQLGQWLSEAGLEMVERSTLAPAGPDANGKLTVKVWLAGWGQTSAAPGSRGAPRSLEQVR